MSQSHLYLLHYEKNNLRCKHSPSVNAFCLVLRCSHIKLSLYLLTLRADHCPGSSPSLLTATHDGDDDSHEDEEPHHAANYRRYAETNCAVLYCMLIDGMHKITHMQTSSWNSTNRINMNSINRKRRKEKH